ncbi:hypothetical protein DFH28DRAFT_921195 [Melampsora americana]|nr:hypothetical protein DFH28DRAFT_921195 [Melampsora americana]
MALIQKGQLYVVHHHHQQQQQVLASTLSSTSYNLTWRQAVCYLLPTAFFGLVASWSKAEVAGRVGIGVWQALEIFASPGLLILVTSYPPLQPSTYSFVLTSLLTFGVSLILLCQSSAPAALALAQALSLVSLKTVISISKLRSPLSNTLLGPVRNLFCLLISPSIHVYVGLTTGNAALVVVYLLTLVGLWAVEPEVGHMVGIRSPIITEVGLRTGVRPGRAPGSIDLFFLYYNEPLDSSISVIEYSSSKSPEGDLEHNSKVTGAEEVITSENVSREGGTYLTHISRHYNASISCAGLMY